MALFLKNFEGAIPNEVARVGRMYGYSCRMMVQSSNLAVVVEIGRLCDELCDDRYSFDLYISPSDDLIEVLKEHLSEAHKILRSGTNNDINHP